METDGGRRNAQSLSATIARSSLLRGVGLHAKVSVHENLNPIARFTFSGGGASYAVSSHRRSAAKGVVITTARLPNESNLAAAAETY